ncbi:MAG: hypothetical protein KC478_11820 [Bacteriovoracaceae bacterium]|nr:hypothetical protein [Bacteriovoracaceae bacterium]
MKTLLFGIVLIASTSSFASNCMNDTKSRVNNGYFWAEAAIYNYQTGAEVTESNLARGIAKTAGSFIRESGDDTPWFNQYFNPEGAQRFVDLRLGWLSSMVGLVEKYDGATVNFKNDFMKKFNKITYCEISRLMQQYFTYPDEM